MTAPVPGPAVVWITADDVAKWMPSVSDDPDDLPLLGEAAGIASSLMYELSGRQFPGKQTRTVRPARQPCSCFGRSSLGPWYWTSVPGWAGWGNECGDRLGCQPLSRIRLAGYPVVSIDAVKIDGATVDASGYRLDGHRWLVRLADTSTQPASPRSWPGCQDLSLPDTAAGTFSVTYDWGIGPPPLGKAAAAQLAAEVFAAMRGAENRLPSSVTTVVRQGVTVQRVVPTADLLREGTTGLELVDAFVANVNPSKQRRRSLVYSPDTGPYGPQVG